MVSFFRQASRLFRLGTTSLLILLDYVVPVFLMLWCSAVIFMTNLESPRTMICLSQIEKNGFRKLSTRDKELNKRTLVASLLGLFVYAIQSVAYGYEMFSAAYMQVRLNCLMFYMTILVFRVLWKKHHLLNKTYVMCQSKLSLQRHTS